MYAKCHNNIPFSSRDWAIFIFLAKASTDEKCHFHSVQEIWHCHCFRIWRSAKPGPMINVILQLLGLDLVSINFSAIFCENIPNGLRVKFHFFQNKNLCKTSTNPKCHLTISWATSCQYQCVCKISSQYSTQFKRYGHFHFFRIWRSAKPRPIIYVILKFLDLINIKVCARCEQFES